MQRNGRSWSCKAFWVACCQMRSHPHQCPHLRSVLKSPPQPPTPIQAPRCTPPFHCARARILWAFTPEAFYYGLQRKKPCIGTFQYAPSPTSLELQNGQHRWGQKVLNTFADDETQSDGGYEKKDPRSSAFSADLSPRLTSERVQSWVATVGAWNMNHYVAKGLNVVCRMDI